MSVSQATKNAIFGAIPNRHAAQELIDTLSAVPGGDGFFVGTNASTNEPVFGSFKTVTGPSGNGAIASHCFHDQSTINATQNSTGYAVLADQVTLNVSSGKTIGHLMGLQFANSVVNGAGTCSSRVGVYVGDSSGTATITNQYGLYVTDLTHAGTTNYAVSVGSNATTGISTTRSKLGPTAFGVDDLLGDTVLTTGITVWAYDDSANDAMKIINRGIPTPAAVDASKYYSGAQNMSTKLGFWGFTETGLVITCFGRIAGFNVIGGTHQFGKLRLSAADDSGNDVEFMSGFGDGTVVFQGPIQHATASNYQITAAGVLTLNATTGQIKMGGGSSTTEGVFWYDYAAHVLKYRDDSTTQTVAHT